MDRTLPRLNLTSESGHTGQYPPLVGVRVVAGVNCNNGARLNCLKVYDPLSLPLGGQCPTDRSYGKNPRLGIKHLCIGRAFI